MTANTTDTTNESSYPGSDIISFRAADPRIELLDQLCSKYGMSRSELLRTAIMQLEEIELDIDMSCDQDQLDTEGSR